MDSGASADGASVGQGTLVDESMSHVDSLYGAAMRLTRNPADAEDLVQDTYVKAFRFAERYQAGTNLKAWLHTILHNTFLNTKRQARRDPVTIDGDVIDKAKTSQGQRQMLDPEQLLLRETLDDDLQHAIDALPETFRQAVWLRDVEEFSYKEIADILAVAPGTVMSRISRGRRMLYDRLVGRAGGSVPSLRIVRGAQTPARREAMGPPPAKAAGLGAVGPFEE